MKRELQNQPGEGNYGAHTRAPRFDKETTAFARQVVPLESIGGWDLEASSTRGTRATILSAKNRWIPAALLTLVIGAIVMAMIALMGTNETSVSSDSSQTISGAASVREALPATQALSQTERPVITEAHPVKASRVPDTRDSLPAGYDTGRDDAYALEHSDRSFGQDEYDKGKIGRRARKAEKKHLERMRKEAERLAGQRRESEGRGEPKPRLIGIYTEKN